MRTPANEQLVVGVIFEEMARRLDEEKISVYGGIYGAINFLSNFAELKDDEDFTEFLEEVLALLKKRHTNQIMEN